MRETAFRIAGARHMSRADAEPRTPGQGLPVPPMKPAGGR